MRKFPAILLLFLVLPVFAARADVADGVRAYDAGWYEEALAEFLPAAEAGDVQAQMALASMYQVGEGVAQSDREAFRWTRAAAERGDPVAQINLSQFLAAGRGVARDAAESYFWLLLAANQGNDWASARLEPAAARLTAADAENEKARTANWSPLGDDLSGSPRVIDGQTLIVDGRRLRLEGIQAPPPGTRCRLRGNDHDC
ncbi:MAG: tetratricopeptide repeat protein, partial [Alphaproteobacteria bacterium]|nr:tetratricopeptide repeat protein [Alphaproteobacteria bacterium]